MFEEVINENGVLEIYFTDAEEKVWFVPQVEGNSDYQAYLSSLIEQANI